MNANDFYITLIQILGCVFIGFPLLAVFADKVALPLYFYFKGE